MESLIGLYNVADGYNGHVIECSLIYDHDNKCLIEKYPFGQFKSPVLPMDVIDYNEACYLVNNHPQGKIRYK